MNHRLHRLARIRKEENNLGLRKTKLGFFLRENCVRSICAIGEICGYKVDEIRGLKS
jgi:hypothetical protein